MDRSYVVDNKASLERLRELLLRLTERDLDRPVGHGWTVKAALAHLAYWDRENLATIEEFERGGARLAYRDADAVNDSMLSQWLAMPSQEVLEGVLTAAEATDLKVATLSTELAETILAQRPRTLIRAMHRLQHLEEIEQALAQ